MRHLLAGVSDQRTLQKLMIRKNEVGNLSAEQLVKILEWTPPFNL
jgi:hypothetical protein